MAVKNERLVFPPEELTDAEVKGLTGRLERTLVGDEGLPHNPPPDMLDPDYVPPDVPVDPLFGPLSSTPDAYPPKAAP